MSQTRGDGPIQEPNGLPDRRQSLTGQTDEGDRITLIRSISHKLYNCGGCRGTIEPGDENVVVEYDWRTGGSEHSHWHRRCVNEILIPSIRGIRAVPAGGAPRRRRRR